MNKYTATSGRLAVLLTLAIAMLVTARTLAIDYIWTGEGGDNLWTTKENWHNDTVPLGSSATYVYFLDDGANEVTSLNGADFTIGKLIYRHPRGTTNIVDLAGGSLTVRGEGNNSTFDIGYGMEGDSFDAGAVIITNGTLQIGDGYLNQGKWINLKSNINIGRTTSSDPTFTGRGRMTVHGAFHTTNLNDLAIGLVGTGKARDSTDSWLDLRGATISSPLGENTWSMLGSLDVGIAATSHGVLYLPATLERMDIGGGFRVGDGRYDRTYGAIDFGQNSALRTLNIGGDFSLGAGGSNALINLPENIALTVGKPEAPSRFIMGYGGSDRGVDAELTIADAPFTAHLSLLQIGGGHSSGNAPDQNPLTLFDLERATSVQIGAEPNKIDTETFTVGGGRYYGTTIMKLPANVTEISVGKFILGSTRSNTSELSFAPASELKKFAVRDVFLVGASFTEPKDYTIAGGSGRFVGLPPGVDFTIGSPVSPAVLGLGDTYQYGQGGLNILAPTNGAFNAHISELRLGVSRRDDVVNKGIKGTLDLRETTLEAFVVGDIAMIGSWTNTVDGFSDNRLGEGRLHLPKGAAEFRGGLYVGDTRDTSYGLLDLNGTLARCADIVEIGVTGEVFARLDGASAGLDLVSLEEEPLRVAPGGRIHVECLGQPVTREVDYWGLRLAGDHRVELESLAGTGALTWDVAILPVALQERFGIYYDAIDNVTIVGIPTLHGTMMIIR